MNTYRYSALNNEGKTVSGTLDADGERAAMQAVVRMGLHPVQVEPEGNIYVAKKAERKNQGLFGGRVSQSDLTDATRELCTFLQAGFPLDRGLRFMAQHTTNGALGELLDDLAQHVREGSSLTEALADHPKEFDGLYQAMVSAGETGGQLTTLLDRLAGMRERSRAFRAQILGALTYPAIMTIVMFASVAVMMIFVVPRFTKMFADMGTALPLSTQILAQFSGILAHYWWLILGGVGIAVVGMMQFRKTEEGRKMTDAWMLRIPLAGPTTVRANVSRLCLTLATLLKSGIPLERALGCARGVSGNIILSLAMDQAAESVKRGVSLGDALAETRVFPDDLVEIVRVGEQSGQLDILLDRAGNGMEEKVRNLIQGLLNAVEPIMIVVMGGVIGFIVMAMMMPIFSMDMGAG